ncbi:Bacilysin biosynthesis protein BacB [Gammaproteobacteria bacterium]
MYFFDWNVTAFKQARVGVFYKTVIGENVQMFYIKLEHGQFTNHGHSQEQMGYILAGEAELIVDGEKKICRSGGAYYIPGNIPHGFRVISGEYLEYIEIFSPPKEGHKKL